MKNTRQISNRSFRFVPLIGGPFQLGFYCTSNDDPVFIHSFLQRYSRRELLNHEKGENQIAKTIFDRELIKQVLNVPFCLFLHLGSFFWSGSMCNVVFFKYVFTIT